MTSPSPKRDDTTVRGAVVLVVAIVIGFGLLLNSGGASGGGNDDDDDARPSGRTGSSTTSAPPGSQSTAAPINSSSTTTSVPSDTRPPDQVTVIVLNGSEQVGIADDNTVALQAAGYVTLDPANANENLEATTVFAAPEFEADASGIAGVLGVPDAVVEIKPEEPLAEGAERANVVVVLGADFAPA